MTEENPSVSSGWTGRFVRFLGLRAARRGLDVEELLASEQGQVAVGESMASAEVLRQLLEAGRPDKLLDLVETLGGYPALTEVLRKALGQLDAMLEGGDDGPVQDAIQSILAVRGPEVNAPEKTEIFLSYARSDDEAFAKRLYETLTHRGHMVWWDRASMPNRGLMFVAEIREAIRNADRVVLVVGPSALNSTYVTAEWDYALRQCCTPVVSVLRLGDYRDIPKALSGYDILDFRKDADFDEQVARLIDQLSVPVAPLGELRQVPSLPARFVPRPDTTSPVLDYLLAMHREAVEEVGRAMCAGFWGLGGVGKSSLAIEVVRDCRLRRAYPDGVFWVGLGQTKQATLDGADLVRLQSDLLGRLGAAAEIADVEKGRAKLQSACYGKQVLIVLDDLHDAAQLDAFDVLGARSAMLLTTEREDLFPEGAMRQPVAVLERAEARLLLAYWQIDPNEARAYGRDGQLTEMANGLPSVVDDVLAEIGHLPMATAVCAANHRDGMSWPQILDALRAHRLEYIDHPAGSVMRSIKLSVDRLQQTAPDVARRYRTLAIFRERDGISVDAVVDYWMHEFGVERLQAERDLLELRWRALALETEPARVGLHELQRNFLVGQWGSELPQAHGRLVDFYATRCAGNWIDAPTDEYFDDNIVHHLVASQRPDEAFRLLTDTSAWQARRRVNDGLAAFAEDVATALTAVGGLEATESIRWTFLLHAALIATKSVAEGCFDVDVQTLAWLGRGVEARGNVLLRDEAEERVSGFLALRDALVELGQTHDELYVRVGEDLKQLAADDKKSLVEVVRTFGLGGNVDRALAALDRAEPSSRADLAVALLEALVQVGDLDGAKGTLEAGSLEPDQVTQWESLVQGDSPAFLEQISGAAVRARVHRLAAFVANHGASSDPSFRAAITDALDALLEPDTDPGWDDPLVEEVLRLSAVLSATEARTFQDRARASNIDGLVAARLTGDTSEVRAALANPERIGWRRVETLAKVACDLQRGGRGDEAAELFLLAESAMGAMPNVDAGKGEACSRLALQLARAGHVDRASRVYDQATRLASSVIESIIVPLNVTSYDWMGLGLEGKRSTLHAVRAHIRIGALREVAQTLRRMGDVEAARCVALVYMEVCHHVRSPRRWVQSFLWAGDLLLELGLASEAEVCREQAVDMLDHFPDADILRVKTYDHFESFGAYAAYLGRHGRLEEAREAFERAREVLGESGKKDVMSMILCLATGEDPQSAQWRNYAIRAAEAGLFDEALTSIETRARDIVNLDSEDARQIGIAFKQVASIQARQGRVQEAIETIRRHQLKMSAESIARFLIDLGSQYAKKEPAWMPELVEAVDHLIPLIPSGEHRTTSWCQLALLHHERGDDAAVEATLRKAHQAAEAIYVPSDEERTLLVGASASEGSGPEARRMAQERARLLNAHRERAWAFQELCVAYARAGRISKAESVLSEGMYEWTETMESAIREARARARDFAPAFRSLRRFCGVDDLVWHTSEWLEPLDVLGLRAKVDILSGVMRVAGWARADWRSLGELILAPRTQQSPSAPAPDLEGDLPQLLFSSVYGIMAGVLLERERWDAARVWYERSLGTAESSGDWVTYTFCLGQLGIVETHAKRYAEAKRRFNQMVEQAVKLDIPGAAASALYHLALMHQAAGNREDAIKAARTSYQVSMNAEEYWPSVGTTLLLGRLSAETQDLDECVAWLARGFHSLLMTSGLPSKAMPSKAGKAMWDQITSGLGVLRANLGEERFIGVLREVGGEKFREAILEHAPPRPEEAAK